MFHIFGPKNERLSLPWYTDLTSGLQNLEVYLKLHQLLPFCLKISFRVVGDRFLLSRKISIARDLKYLTRLKIEPSIYSTVVLKTMSFYHCK